MISTRPSALFGGNQALQNIQKYLTLDSLFSILIVLLPFTTILSVFTKEVLHIPGVSFYKELLLIMMGGLVVWLISTQRQKLRWGWIDTLLIGYMGYLIGVSLFTTGLRGIVYGGRYDFEFLIAFWIVYHGAQFLTHRVSHFVRLFLISGGITLFLGFLVRFVFGEDILLYFGFSGNPSAWQFGATPPIFHGVDGANIRRFQGIFDGPNTMGGFLLIYIAFLLYYFRYKKDWYFVLGLVVFGLAGLLFFTYSRSAILALVISGVIVFLMSFSGLWRRYRQEILILSACIILGIGVFYRTNGPSSGSTVISRPDSSKGHYERLITGLDRFVSAPLGQGLGSSGPGYRYVENLEGFSRTEIEKKDEYYIPESWYVQQLVEGGVIGASLFAVLFLLILARLSRIHPLLFAGLFSICLMNIVLHTFETTTISLPLFLLVGLVLGRERDRRRWVKESI